MHKSNTIIDDVLCTAELADHKAGTWTKSRTLGREAAIIVEHWKECVNINN